LCAVSFLDRVDKSRLVVVGPSVSARSKLVGNKSGVAEEVKPFASTIDLVIPNGPCFSKDGFLFVVEQNRVLMYPAAEFFYESPDVVAVPIVPQGELIPKEDESYNHTARTCRVGPDNKLYITLGQPFNAPAPEKLDGFKKWGIGGIIRMDRDGKNREVYACGIRNSVGMDFSPKDKTLWFTDNQVDGMGDDQPPGPRNESRAEFRLPLLRRRTRPHRGIQE
jgi:glucose/arabinose dehydrogenase